jgi:hypothetical protein
MLTREPSIAEGLARRDGSNARDRASSVVLLGGSRERRLSIDVPVADAILAAGSGQVRHPTTVLDADQQQRLSRPVTYITSSSLHFACVRECSPIVRR